MPHRDASTTRRILRHVMFLLTTVMVLGTACLGLWQLWRTEPVNPIPPGLTGQALVDHLNGLDATGIQRLQDYAAYRLERNALDPDALQYLGISLGLKKDMQRQEDVALNAARYSLRDPRMQFTAVNIALGQKKYDEAIHHLDGLLRARPELGKDFYPVLLSILAEDDAITALAKVLVELPPWRRSLVTHLLGQPHGWELAQRLFGAVRQAGGDVSAAEMKLMLSVLIKDKNYEQAYFVWLDSLDTASLTHVQNVFDSGFDLEPRGEYFDWTIREPKNASISVTNRPGSAANRALKLDFAGYQGAFSHVTQHLRLSPGDYVLSQDVLVQAMQASRGLVWRLRCADTKKVIAETAEIKDAGPWTVSRTALTVPAADCDTQVLQLETAARGALDTRLSGTLYLDDVAIEPLTGQVPGDGDIQQ